MANAYSIIHNYDNQPLYSPDFNFIQAALSARQGKYDHNKAKLNNIYSQLEALQVAKGVDQKHIEERLQRIYDTTDRYGVMDLSDDNLATSIFANLGQVFDQKTKNAIVSTKRMQREDSEWEYMRVNDPDKYAELNHQYALQKSDRQGYLDSEVAGDVYRGGANFIEYVDVNRNFFNMVPEIQKMLKATYIEEGPNKGYFRDLITHEKVDPDKVASVYDMLLDDKSKRQLSINAWGTYDKMADSDLKEVWNSMRQPALDKINANISALEIQLRDPRYADQKAQIQEALDYYKDNKVSYENETFEAVYNDIGREGLYTNLYNHQFKNKIVTTYSYDNIVKRELDQAHAESIKFQQKLNEFSYQKEKDAREYALKVRKDNREQAEFEIKYGLSQGGGSSDLTPIDFLENESEKIKDIVGSFTKEMSDAYNDVQEVLKNTFGHNLTNDQMQQALSELSPGNIDPNEIVSITIGGVTKEIDMRQHYDKFQKAHNKLQKDDPVLKEMYSGISKVVDNTIFRNRTLVTKGVNKSVVLDGITNFQFMHEEINGRLEIVDRKNPGVNYHAWLLKKRQAHVDDPENNPALTRAELSTLRHYTSVGLISDKNLPIEDRKMVDMWMRHELLTGVKTNGKLLDFAFMRDIAISGGNTANQKRLGDIQRKQAEGHRLSTAELEEKERLTKSINENDRKSRLYGGLRNNVTGGLYKTFSQMGGWYDSRYTDAEGITRFGDIEGAIKSDFNVVRKGVESKLEAGYSQAPTTKEYEIKYGTASYNAAKSLLNLPANTKDVIVVRRPLKSDGTVDTETTEVELIHRYNITKDGAKIAKESEPVRKSRDILQERGIPVFSEATRSVYDTRLGSSAQKIPLGNNSGANTAAVRSEQRIRNNATLPLDGFNSWVSDFDKNTARQLIDIKAAYDAGKLIFQYENIGGQYYPTISVRNDKKVLEVVYIDETSPMGSLIQETEVKNIISAGGTNQFYKVERTFANYLNSLVK